MIEILQTESGIRNMRKKKIDRHKIMVVAAFLVMMLVWLYWGLQKEDLFCDEYYTFAAANSRFGDENMNFSKDIEEASWITTDYFTDKYSIDKTEIFDYASVWNNQKLDVHPPLYYILIHFISSFFIDQFSIMAGILTNMLCALVTMISVYNIFRLTIKKTYICMLATLVCGLNRGYINSVMFVRMWNMVAMFTVIMLWLYLNIEYGKIKKGRFLLSIAVVNILGMLTQYYFAIICFEFAVIYILFSGYKIIKKQNTIGNLLQYIIVNIVSAGIYLLIWPASIEHVFFGYRGQEAFENISKAGSLLHNYKTMFNFISDDIFAGLGLIVVGCIAGVIICLYIQKKLNNTAAIYMCMGVVAGIYFMIVSQISEIKSARYLYPIYPLVIICCVGLFYFFFSIYETRGINVICLLMICSCFMTFLLQPDHLYKGRKNNTEYISGYGAQYCLYIGHGSTWYNFCENSMDYMAFDNMKVVFLPEDVELIKDDLILEKQQAIVVLIDSANDVDSVLTKIGKNMWDGESEHQYIRDNKKCKAYLFERTDGL